MTNSPVGFIGLGIIGEGLSTNLINDAFEVVGYDTDPERMAVFESLGGTAAASIADVATHCEVVFVAVATLGQLPAIASELALHARPGLVVLDVGTLPTAEKELARAHLARRDASLVDCPLSGTGAQAVARDIVFMPSGDTAAIERVRPILEQLARAVHPVGPFGNGIAMKLIANHLVAVHNAAAAEALLIAEKAGLDLSSVLKVVGDGAGASRMFEVRGPMMAARRFEPATARVDMFLKDLQLVKELAVSVSAATPLLDLVRELYDQATTYGLGGSDTAAVHQVIESMADPDAGTG